MVYKPKNSNRWWYKFVWNGELIRQSTQQANKRVAEQMEAAHRTGLAKGDVGIRERVAAPKLAEFIQQDFLPFLEARFAAKAKTLEYYRNGVQKLTAFAPLAEARLDTITGDKIASFIARGRARGLKVSSINRELEVLRRMLRLALEWGKLDKAPPKIQLLPGEAHRDRVLTAAEEIHYFEAAERIGEAIESAYERALQGIRAQHGKQPIPPEDPFLLRDVAALLLDCGLRPEEAFRLRWEEVRDGAVHVLYGKTANARRRVPLSARVSALLEARSSVGPSEWVFPAHTASGHIEKSTPKTTQARVCTSEGQAVSAVHIPPHLRDSLGGTYGPVHTGLPGRPQRFCYDQALRASASRNRARRHGTSARSTGGV